MKLLLKLGGTLLDDPSSLIAIARQIARIATTEHQVVVVHGGGKQVTRFLAERGVESQFVNGLRVSDAAVMRAVTHVIGGGVNKQLVAALNATGTLAVGLSGVDGNLTSAVRLSAELGFVGRTTGTDPKLLDLLFAGGYLPVVACLAGDGQGHIYNVNADSMAVSCAIGWKAERLIFLTDVGGVKDGSGEVVSRLTSALVQELIETRVAHGGMEAKLNAARAAVEAGMQVDIASGAEPDAAVRLLRGESLGTHWAQEGLN